MQASLSCGGLQAGFEKEHKLHLLLAESVPAPGSFDASRLQGLEEFAGGIAFQHSRMDVALTADGRRVAEFFSHVLDGLHDVSFSLSLRLKNIKFPQCQAG